MKFVWRSIVSRLQAHSAVTWWTYTLERDGHSYHVVIQAKSWRYGCSRGITVEDVWLSEDDIDDVERSRAVARAVGELPAEQLAALVSRRVLRRIA